MRRVVVLLLVLLVASATTASAEPEWSIAPPAGWKQDAAAAAEMKTKLEDAFFQGLGVAVETIAYRDGDAADAPRMLVMRIDLNDRGHAGTPDEVVDGFVRKLQGTTRSLVPVEHRADDNTLVGTWRFDGTDATKDNVLAFLVARDAQRSLQLLGLLCVQPKGATTCGEVATSMRLIGVARPREPRSWLEKRVRDYRFWIGVVGGLLLLTGIVGSIVTRRKRSG
ncbi:MAG TPA: hypothetical protein VFQ53_05190 [Kofleriaceae bacterium]|nr:hypothetical protein [Kofleriaceae bacterium]